MYVFTFCLLAMAATTLGHIDDSQFSNAIFCVTFTLPNTIKITPNAWRNDIGLMAYHCNINTLIAAPTAGKFDSPDILSAPWSWESANAAFVKGATINFWVRMETNGPKPAPGYNSAMKRATLQ